jgi:hypothetical protein
VPGLHGDGPAITTTRTRASGPLSVALFTGVAFRGGGVDSEAGEEAEELRADEDVTSFVASLMW